MIHEGMCATFDIVPNFIHYWFNHLYFKLHALDCTTLLWSMLIFHFKSNLLVKTAVKDQKSNRSSWCFANTFFRPIFLDHCRWFFSFPHCPAFMNSILGLTDHSSYNFPWKFNIVVHKNEGERTMRFLKYYPWKFNIVVHKNEGERTMRFLKYYPLSSN